MLEVFIAAMATWEIVEIWHHSSLMATWRAKTSLWNNKLGELLACPFCLSVWVAAVTVLTLKLPIPENQAHWAIVVQIVQGVVTLFAVARLANVGNDLTHYWCRTPKNTFPSGDPPELTIAFGDSPHVGKPGNHDV